MTAERPELEYTRQSRPQSATFHIKSNYVASSGTCQMSERSEDVLMAEQAAPQRTVTYATRPNPPPRSLTQSEQQACQPTRPGYAPRSWDSRASTPEIMKANDSDAEKAHVYLSRHNTGASGYAAQSKCLSPRKSLTYRTFSRIYPT
jgi:hypothetical protein